jgi:uncharacterized membrane protein
LGSASVLDAFIVVGVAALPISELRGAIPLAIIGYQMPPLLAYLLGVFGNLIPVVLLLPLLERLVLLLGRVGLLMKLIRWLFGHTRRRFSRSVERLGALALVLVVAVPLPVTGAWTGCLIAFIFGIPLRQAFPLIGLGVLIAGVIVTLSTLGVLKLF